MRAARDSGGDADRPAAPDGVHIRIENRTNKDLGFEIRNLGGDNAEGEVVWPIPPGDVQVRCDDFSTGFDDSPYVSFEVVDPEGLFVSPEVECGPFQGRSTGIPEYVEDARGDTRDPLLIARDRFAPLQTGEELQRAGYPRAENRLVRLVRDGRVVEVLEYTRDSRGRGWLETEHTKCS